MDGYADCGGLWIAVDSFTLLMPMQSKQISQAYAPALLRRYSGTTVNLFDIKSILS